MTIAAATRMSLESALSCIGDRQDMTGSTINHVVSDAFFKHRATYSLPFRILFVGELSEKKGLLDLRTVMEDLQNYPAIVEIVGDGPLRRVAIEMASRPGCAWHGHVKDRVKLAEIVGRCHVLVAPSIRMGQWEELFGISIVEAMASGLLCIASDHTGPQSIITNGHDGILVKEKSPHTISDHIVQLLNDQAMWMKMSNHAAETGRQYSLSTAAGQWEDLLAAHVTAVRASSGVTSSRGSNDNG